MAQTGLFEKAKESYLKKTLDRGLELLYLQKNGQGNMLGLVKAESEAFEAETESA